MHEILQPFAWCAARAIELWPPLVELFRRTDFKGKQLISSQMHLPAENAIHNCGGAVFDLDFSDGIQQEIFWGTYERREKAFLKDYVGEGWTCVDIGANVGFYTVNLAFFAGKSGKVYAIEADTENFASLKRNVELNLLENVQIFNLAISSNNGLIEFFKSPAGNSGWGRAEPFKGSAGTHTIKALSFDSFLSQSSIDVVDFLKIDIEGHELQFLEGAKQSFADGRIKRLLIEYCGYSLESKGVSLFDYVKAVEDHGMLPVSLHLNKVADAKAGTYTPQREVFNLLFESRI